MTNAQANIEAWLRALETRDVDSLIGAMADRVELELDGMERIVLSKDTLRSYLEDLGDPYERVQIERKKLVASGLEVALLVRARVKMAPTNLSFLGEELPTAGKEVDLVTAVFFTLDEAGKIVRLARVRDNLQLAEQLGMSAERMRSLITQAARSLR